MKQQTKPTPPRKPERKPERRPTETLYGLRAGLAIAEHRPSDLVAIAYHRDLERELEPLLRLAEAKRIPTEEQSDEALCRLANTKNHEGLVLETKPRAFLNLQDLTARLVQSRGTAIALDRVRNPYNIGAIIRTAAFFGIDAVLLGAPAPHPGLPPDAIRVAEGGAELLSFSRTTDLADTLARLKSRNISIVGAESEGGKNLFTFAFSPPTVLVLGHEREGLSERVMAQCNALVAIPGTGKIGSLNVSIAASITIAELARKKFAKG